MNLRRGWLVGGVCALLALGGCGGSSGGGGSPPDDDGAGGGPEPPSPPPPSPPPPPPPPPVGFQSLSDEAWDVTAVQKVLQTFAYGGQAGDAQVQAWADQPPAQAIREILTFEEHNPQLSPLAPDNTDSLDTRPGTLRGLSDFWSSDDPANGVAAELRQYYGFPLLVWYRATLSRGLNPFRQKIGLWETNYHLAVNFRVGVNGNQIIRYYDDIMGGLGGDLPYQNVLTRAATSAAIARQYGHFTNVYVNGECLCNEDFAREYHQLFYGILGEYDPDYHETVAIKNTAAALTDMRLDFDPVTMDFVDTLFFGRTFHTPGPLDILQASIGGNDARQRIDALSQVAIEQPESLANLPVAIIEGLADDNLDAERIATIREAWAAMNPKNLLEFLRTYAISDTFHHPGRYKFRTSVERHFIIANQMNLSNAELDLELYTPYDLEAEDVTVFAPRHNVFGAQRSLEAAESADVFRNNFNRVTREHWRYRLPAVERFGRTWEKDWGNLAPQDDNGDYRVEQVAEWLWQRFVADGLANFGLLERAHVYAFLATDLDLVYLVNRLELEASGQDPEDLDLYDFDRIVTTAALEGDPALRDLVDYLADQTLELASADTGERQVANARIGQAVNFIVATPYMFAEEGL